jgi:O-methyltransferase
MKMIFAKKVLQILEGNKILMFCMNKAKIVLCRRMAYIGRNRAPCVHNNIFGDYLRISSLELVAHEIYENNIEGCVAELGVYRGDFARRINEVFYDRRIYLFDTFEGFDKRDVKVNTDRNFSTGKQDFSNTNIDLVLSKMKHPENCIVRKGFFPDTAKNIEEKFVFASIDVDLYEPIYQGLCYFYPRLQKGGYIFVHDYNNASYSGVKAAVERYASEINIPYFPLSDVCGSVVLMK